MLVEVGLEVLEREREVEDVDIPTAGRRQGVAHVRTDGGGAVHGAGGHRAAQDEARAGEAVDLDGGQLRAGEFWSLSCESFPLWKVGWRRLGDERLDGRQDLVHRHRLGERAVGGRGHLQHRVQRRRVARLDRVDRQRRGEDLLALDVPGLTEVRGRAEVLDRRRPAS